MAEKAGPPDPGEQKELGQQGEEPTALGGQGEKAERTSSQSIEEIECPGGESMEKTHCPGCESMEKTHCPGCESMEKTRCPGCESMEKTHCPGCESMEKTHCPGCESMEKTHCPGCESMEKTHCPGCKSMEKTLCPGSESMEKTNCPGRESMEKTHCPRCESMEQTESYGCESMEKIHCPGCESMEKTHCPGCESMEQTESSGCESMEKTHCPGCESMEKTHCPGCESMEKTHCPGCESMEKTHCPGCESMEKTHCPGCKSMEKTLCPGCESMEKTHCPGCKSMEKTLCPGCESMEKTHCPGCKSREKTLCPDPEPMEQKQCPDHRIYGPDHQTVAVSPNDQPIEEAECPGCQSVGTVALSCGHRLCAACTQLCQGELGRGGCTVCYGANLMDSVLHTLLEALFKDQPRRPGVPPRARGGDAGVINAGVQVRTGAWGEERNGEEEEELCTQHGKPLTLFCLEEEEPVCWECQNNRHKNHQCCSLKEAALDCKRELRSALRALQDQLDSLTSTRDTWQDTAAYIKSQSEHTEQVVREEFEKLHQYLRDEEAAAMESLKQEEEEKSQRMRERIDRLADDISTLADALRETEEAMALEDFSFLKNYKKASEKAHCRIEEPEEQSGALLDVAEHLSCLQHHVWEKMQTITQYFPVTLDPNTASVCLSVSADLAGVSVSEEEQEQRQSLPDNPERFVCLQSVLGSEGFTSGRHSWEVEVGDNSGWSLGVARETVRRKDWSPGAERRSGPLHDPGRSSDSERGGGGLWTVSLSAGEYCATPGQSTPLKLRRRPRKVRVQLDWERGCLTFSDANDNSLIYRFKQRWSSTLRPYLSTTCSKHPLRIAAGRVSITTE